MTALTISETFTKDTLLSGSKLDTNFTTIKDFLNCQSGAGLDSTNLGTCRFANSQLAEPNALIFTPTLVVVQQTDVARTDREQFLSFYAPCDMVLVDIAINLYTIPLGQAATASVDCINGQAWMTFDSSKSDNNAIGVNGLAPNFEIKEGSVIHLRVAAMSANVEFLTARAIFKAQHTGR